jgi:hypothetical protein
VTELFNFKDKPTLKTPTCQNCKYLDMEDHKKNYAILRYNCTLKNEWKYPYSRCNEHTEAIKGTVRLNEQVIILNPKGGVK